MTDSDRIARAQAELEERRQQLPPKPVAPKVGETLAGGAVPQTGEFRGYAQILKQLSSKDPKVRQRARFAVSDDARRNLHRFKQRTLPSFPRRLPPESVLMGILKKRGKQRSATDKASVRLFVGWRTAVIRAEHSNEATLRALFQAVATFRELELPDYTVQILEHLEIEFEIEFVPEPRFWQLERLTRDFKTLSVNLRRGEYVKKPKKTTHPEDDDTALQGDLTIPAPGSKPSDGDPDDAYDALEFP